DTVYRTFVTTARGLEPAMAYYGLLDRTPRGRHEDGELEHWLRRHDEYGWGARAPLLNAHQRKGEDSRPLPLPADLIRRPLRERVSVRRGRPPLRCSQRRLARS